LKKEKTGERNNKKCGNKILREIVGEKKKDVGRKFRKIAL
jgi:hypothetical protein